MALLGAEMQGNRIHKMKLKTDYNQLIYNKVPSNRRARRVNAARQVCDFTVAIVCRAAEIGAECTAEMMANAHRTVHIVQNGEMPQKQFIIKYSLNTLGSKSGNETSGYRIFSIYGVRMQTASRFNFIRTRHSFAKRFYLCG